MWSKYLEREDSKIVGMFTHVHSRGLRVITSSAVFQLGWTVHILCMNETNKKSFKYSTAVSTCHIWCISYVFVCVQTYS